MWVDGGLSIAVSRNVGYKLGRKEKRVEDCENKWRLMSCETERIFYCIGTTSHECVCVLHEIYALRADDT